MMPAFLWVIVLFVVFTAAQAWAYGGCTWPRWIPQVMRPWNPAYQDTWDMMTPDEKRGSFVFDMIVVVLGLVIFLYAMKGN